MQNQASSEQASNEQASDAAASNADAVGQAPQSWEEALSVVWKSVVDLGHDFLNHLPVILVGVLALVLTWIIAAVSVRIASALMKRTRLKSSLQDLFRQLLAIGVWLAGITIAAIIVFPGMTPAKVLAVLGLGSVAVGFAFKDIFENFFAGILILWRFPFDPGDYIQCGDIAGKVEEVTIRMTLIRQTNGELVVVPNATLFKEPVNVLTDRGVRRITVICGVAYGEDVDESRQVIQRAVQGCETVRDEKPIEIFAQEFAASSINFEVTWWAGATPLEERKSRDEVVAAVKKALDQAEIEIPFPYRTLTFKEPLHTLSNGERRDEVHRQNAQEKETQHSS